MCREAPDKLARDANSEKLEITSDHANSYFITNEDTAIYSIIKSASDLVCSLTSMLCNYQEVS